MPLPVLYSDIIDYILALFDLYDGDERNELSNCALVCKEWCQISRRRLFGNIDDIGVGELLILRDLLETQSGGCPCTFATWVRSAYSMIDFSLDEWGDATELLKLLNNHFPSDFKFSLLLTGRSLTSQHLSDIQSSIPNLIHIGLVVVEMQVSMDEIRRFLGDNALPRLRRLSVCASGWKTTELDGVHFARSALSLDNLLFQELQPFEMETRFWPQQVFLNLNVKTVIIQAKTNNTSFWEAVPELLDKISTNLEGLDVSYALDYDFFTKCTQNIIFPKLRTLVLKIKHGLAPDIRAAKQTDGETALQNLLSQIKIPAISTIFIIIADAHEYILPGNGEPQWKWYESLQWNIIDNALCDLTNTPHDIPGTWRLPSSHTRSRQPFHLRLSRVVIGAWHYDWSMSSVSTEDAILYLEEHLPQCVKHGVKICFKVVEDDLELLGV